MMDTIIYLTRAKQKSLEEQLAYMESDGVKKLSQLLAASPSSGMGRPLDLPIHDLARTFYNELDGLKTKLRYAAIIDDIKKDPDTVCVGATVSLYDEALKLDITYTILGPEEVEPSKEKISFLSPLGSALVGKKEGDIINLKSIDKKYIIKKIEYKKLDFEYKPTDWSSILDSAL